MKKAKPMKRHEEEKKAIESFKRWYEDETMYGQELPPEERHAMGMLHAIQAVFHLGQNIGYAAGYKDAQSEHSTGISSR